MSGVPRARAGQGSGAISRLVEVFLAPAAAVQVAERVAQGQAVQVAEHVAPSAVAVLCGPSAVAVAGAAVGLAALAGSDAGTALICRWTGAEQTSRTRSLATAAARRLAARLAARDLAAGAHGRLVTVALPADPDAARTAAAHAAAAAGDVPVVVVVAGARPTELDPLLAAQDRVLVVPDAGAPEGLEALAVAGAARVGRATGVLRVGAATPARAAVIAGWVLPPALRTAAAAALEGHGC
jgi:hypothetical protein